MNTEILKKVIYDQHEIIRNFNIIDRAYTFEESMNYILVGLRRSGKTRVRSYRQRNYLE